MKPLIALVLIGLSAACSRDPERPRQESAPHIPDHPLRDRLIGEWETEGQTVYVVAREADGRVTLVSPPTPPWESVINSVRWKENVLHYDEYNYCPPDPNLIAPNNPTGDHPYSGVRNESTLTLTDDPDRVVHRIMTSQLTEPVSGDLTRRRR